MSPRRRGSRIPVQERDVSVIRLAIVAAVVLVPGPLLAQSTVERHVSVGAANFVAPIVTSGVDVITPQGLSVGAGGTLVVAFFEGPWALYGVSARAGFHGRDYSKTQPFVVGELGYFRETDCCGGSVLAGVNVGVTRWRNQKSAFRIEGRLLLPLAEEGGLVIFQVGLTFR